MRAEPERIRAGVERFRVLGAGAAFDAAVIEKPANYDAWGEGKPTWLEESLPTWHGAGGPLYNYRDHDKFVRAYLATLLSVDESVGRITRR